MHIYDRRFPAIAGARLTPPDALASDYRSVQSRLGLTHTVVVTPSTYGTDNASLVHALKHLGQTARGVAVADETVSDAELEALHSWGVRGIRFNQTTGAVVRIQALEPLAERIRRLGWHIQLLLKPDDLVAMESRLRVLPVPIVFDHMGRLPEAGLRHPGFAAIVRLLERGNTWVKLSGAYLYGGTAQKPSAVADALARAYLDIAPGRLVWGSNWPHPTASAGLHAMPNDQELLNLLADWTGGETLFRQVLVENPAALYDACNESKGSPQ